MPEPVLYFDNNATTPVAEEVLEAMLPWFRERCANASSVHGPGQEAAEAVAAARASVARLLGAASPGEVVFTGGGTESINTAIRSGLAARPDRRSVVTTTAEHSATLKPLEKLEERAGLTVVRAGVDAEGRPDLDAIRAALADGCGLASLLWVNNETGVVLAREDLEAVGAACREAGALLHLDAVQAAGKLPLDAAELPVDMLSISAHKLHGPKGVGALWVRSGTPFEPLILGGPQEKERRAGTLNVTGIVGLGAAADLARRRLDAVGELAARRDELERRILDACPGARVNAAAAERVANTSSIVLPEADGEALLVLLSELGLAVSTGSACDSERRAPSHVLLAMGLSAADAGSTLRLSLSHETTDEQVERAADLVATAVAQLREIASPGTSAQATATPPG